MRIFGYWEVVPFTTLNVWGGGGGTGNYGEVISIPEWDTVWGLRYLVYLQMDVLTAAVCGQRLTVGRQLAVCLAHVGAKGGILISAYRLLWRFPISLSRDRHNV